MASTTDSTGPPGGELVETVRIRYHRPPHRTDTFVQQQVLAAPGLRITYLERTPLHGPVTVNGTTILEDGSPVVWFTFPGVWHDIGRFHLADGRFTGLYANVLTPVRFLEPNLWETTDLCLDVWWAPAGQPRVLDADELAKAERNGWIGSDLAQRARTEAARILRAARHGEWPPEPVRRWTLERVRGSRP